MIVFFVEDGSACIYVTTEEVAITLAGRHFRYGALLLGNVPEPEKSRLLRRLLK
jgi:hypothetical protein